ncbi:MAG: hypothetical protein IJF58_04200 [Clostridia bacterium]|nr:hypothetical protein [Clostridia bacterium]
MTENINYISAAEQQNKMQEELAKKRKEQAKLDTAIKNQQVTQAGADDIGKLSGKYRSIYDENAVKQYIGERKVAENMANLGLTDSGLNRTQQTALGVSRGNADYNTRLQYESAVRSIEQSVRDEIAANNNALTTKLDSIDQQVAEDNANRLYNAEIKQMEYYNKQQEKAAETAKKEQETTEKAEKEASEKATKERKDLLNTLMTAFKSSVQTGITAPHAGEILMEYIIMHNLSVTEAQLVLTSGGLAAAKLKDDFFEIAVKERDRWQGLKTNLDKYNAATEKGENYSVVSSFEKALDNYNVEQYGADKLLPLLVRDRYLTTNDMARIKQFYNLFIGKNPAEKLRVYGEKYILDYANSLYTNGEVSQLASQYMAALLNYHKG